MRLAENEFLQELKQGITNEDKTLDMYGFPSPASKNINKNILSLSLLCVCVCVCVF